VSHSEHCPWSGVCCCCCSLLCDNRHSAYTCLANLARQVTESNSRTSPKSGRYPMSTTRSACTRPLLPYKWSWTSPFLSGLMLTPTRKASTSRTGAAGPVVVSDMVDGCLPKGKGRAAPWIFFWTFRWAVQTGNHNIGRSRPSPPIGSPGNASRFIDLPVGFHKFLLLLLLLLPPPHPAAAEVGGAFSFDPLPVRCDGPPEECMHACMHSSCRSGPDGWPAAAPRAGAGQVLSGWHASFPDAWEKPTKGRKSELT
jgi:hypothetical protein